MLLALALLLVIGFSLLLTAALRPTSRPAAMLAVYLLSYSNIVLVGQVTNTFYRLNQPAWWLVGHAVLLGAAGLVWLRAGKPALRAPWVDASGRLIPAGWRAPLRAYPELWLLGLGVAVLFAYNAALIWHVPPNNNDSLATHMARVAYWFQRGSFFPWPTERVWQVTYPVNMQLQMFWLALFTGVDRLVELVQWSGALAAATAVFGLARLLGASRPQAAFAGLLFTTFPEIILESTSTQNDLVAGALFAAMLFLLFLGLRTRQRSMLVLSGLALALGWGTKQTLFFLLPGLALVILLVLLFRRASIQPVLIWAGSAFAAFLLLGMYMFVVNQAHFGTPMGPEEAVTAQTGGQNQQSLADNLYLNIFRLAYQAIDPTGLPDPLTGYGFKAKARVVGKIVSLLGYPVEGTRATAATHTFSLSQRYVLQEDAAWYGPLFSFVVLPALLYQGITGWKRRDPLRVGILVLTLSFLVINAALRPGWDPFQGRYFIPVVAIATALAAFVIRPGRQAAVLRWLLAALALVIAYTTVTENSGKPVNDQQNVWRMDWVQMVTLQSFYMRDVVRMVEAQVPADATLGLVTFDTYLEYPLFRPEYSRRLVQISPAERFADAGWTAGQGLEYVLVLPPENTPGMMIPPGWQAVDSRGRWTLYVRSTAGD